MLPTRQSSEQLAEKIWGVTGTGSDMDGLVYQKWLDRVAKLLTAHDAEVRAELTATGPCGKHPRIFVKKDVHPSDEYHSLGMEKITETCILCLELDKIRSETLAMIENEVSCEMLNSIVGSLRGYPDHGGDIGVMKEVQRIELEARIAEAEWVRDHTGASSGYHSRYLDLHIKELKARLAALDAPKGEGQ